jgi:electron transfer flavoprotein alpha subunit
MQTFIYLEPSDEGIAPVAKQIAARVKQIPPAIRGPVRGIAIGGHLQNDSANQLAGLVDELLMVEAPQGSEYNTEVIANVLAAVVGENGPGTLFLTFSHQGMELAPAIGWRLGVPVVTSCTAVDWLGKEAKIRRNIFAGKLLLF